jgi:hypothetical protein
MLGHHSETSDSGRLAFLFLGHGKAGHYSREYMVVQSCLLLGFQEAKTARWKGQGSNIQRSPPIA